MNFENFRHKYLKKKLKNLKEDIPYIRPQSAHHEALYNSYVIQDKENEDVIKKAVNTYNNYSKNVSKNIIKDEKQNDITKRIKNYLSDIGLKDIDKDNFFSLIDYYTELKNLLVKNGLMYDNGELNNQAVKNVLNSLSQGVAFRFKS